MTSNIILRVCPSNWLSFESRKEENEKKAKVCTCCASIYRGLFRSTTACQEWDQSRKSRSSAPQTKSSLIVVRWCFLNVRCPGSSSTRLYFPTFQRQKQTDLCEFKVSLHKRVLGQPELQSKTLSQKKLQNTILYLFFFCPCIRQMIEHYAMCF